VFVVDKDNKAEYRPVTLGPQIDGLRVVRDGLKAGEKIVVNGLQRVQSRRTDHAAPSLRWMPIRWPPTSPSLK
jgi:multidrug efflux pump subunit AcrA (membrane-fusion protein)